MRMRLHTSAHMHMHAWGAYTYAHRRIGASSAHRRIGMRKCVHGVVHAAPEEALALAIGSFCAAYACIALLAERVDVLVVVLVFSRMRAA